MSTILRLMVADRDFEKRRKCRTPGCLYSVKQGRLCHVCLREMLIGNLDERASEVFEELTAAARGLLWEWERRSRRGIRNIKLDSPYVERLQIALRQSEDILIAEARERD